MKYYSADDKEMWREWEKGFPSEKIFKRVSSGDEIEVSACTDKSNTFVIYFGHPGKLNADSNPFEGYECQTEDKKGTGASNPAAMQLYLKPGVTPEDMADIFDGLAHVCRHLGRLCDRDKMSQKKTTRG